MSCYNFAYTVNLQTIVTSNTPIIIDRSPPTSGQLNDGPIKDSDADYQSDKAEICVNWEGISDPHSGVPSFQWGVGTSPGTFDTVPLQNVTDEEAADRLVCAGVDLVHSATYYSTVIATNGADDPLTTTLSTDGGIQCFTLIVLSLAVYMHHISIT